MCDHKQFRCTNCVFYCLKCGAQIPNPYEKKAEETPAPEPKKTAIKRKKKGAEDA